MLAAIEKVEDGYIAKMDRNINHSVEAVWSYLTENEKLSKWFSELSVEDLRIGGLILFDMQDGTFEKMVISDLQDKKALEYEWGEDKVRFELSPNDQGCKLTLIEKISKVTEHTPRDIAGWHVCLDVIRDLLDGKTIDSRMDQWKIWYEKYIDLFEKVK